MTHETPHKKGKTVLLLLLLTLFGCELEPGVSVKCVDGDKVIVDEENVRRYFANSGYARIVTRDDRELLVYSGVCEGTDTLK